MWQRGNTQEVKRFENGLLLWNRDYLPLDVMRKRSASGEGGGGGGEGEGEEEEGEEQE